jgi:hypothetical protein
MIDGGKYMENNQRKAIDMDDVMCPVCGEYQMEYFGNYCPVCGWEHMPTAFIDPDLYDSANHSSLNDYIKWFQEKRIKDPNYIWDKDPKKYEYYAARLDLFNKNKLL